MEYVTSAKHCKYSESDKVYKIYKHKLYKILINSIPDNMQEDEFYISESKYKWMSIEEMEQYKTIKDRNDDIVAFVKSNCKR